MAVCPRGLKENFSAVRWRRVRDWSPAGASGSWCADRGGGAAGPGARSRLKRCIRAENVEQGGARPLCCAGLRLGRKTSPCTSPASPSVSPYAHPVLTLSSENKSPLHRSRFCCGGGFLVGIPISCRVHRDVNQGSN